MTEPIRRRQIRLLWLVALGAAAYLTNRAPVPLSFGLHFLFGGLFAMLAAILFGPWAGALVATLGAIPTFSLWGHPYALVSMTLEAWLVGYAARRGRMHHTETDLVYWLLIGGPLVLVTYTVGAKIPLMATGVAALKQAVNGLVNTSAASVLVLGLLWWQRDQRRHLPLEVLLSNLITFLVLAPLAFSLNWMARESGQQVRGQLSGEAIRAGDVVRLALERELGDQRRALHILAGQANRDLLLGTLPGGIRAVWFLDENGHVAAQLPDGLTVNPDRLREQAPGSLVDLGSYGLTALVDEPMSRLADPRFARAVAALDLEGISRRVLEGIRPLEMEVVVADPKDRVLFASWEGVDREATFVSDLGQIAFFRRAERAGGSPLGSASGLGVGESTSLEQAERLVFVHRTAESQLGWQVYVRKPLGVVEYLLYRSYLRSYVIALSLITLLLVTVRLVAYTVTRPLVALAAITVSPEGDLTNLPMTQQIWVTEVRAVTSHLVEVGERIRSLVQSLWESQRELERYNVELSVANLHLADEALRDAATGLFNQRAFLRQVQLWVEENHPFSLLLADWQGDQAADESVSLLRAEERLKQVARELQQSVALHGGEAYRQGGDRFALLFPEANPWLIERMTRVLSTVFGGSEVVGSALFPEDGPTVPAILQIAEQRLNQARQPDA